MNRETIINYADTSNFSTASDWLRATSKFVESCDTVDAFTFIKSLRFRNDSISKPFLCATLEIACGVARPFCVVAHSRDVPVEFTYQDAVRFILMTMFIEKYPSRLRYLDKYSDVLSLLSEEGINQCGVAKELFLRGLI
jgi:hypothetical protein